MPFAVAIGSPLLAAAPPALLPGDVTSEPKGVPLRRLHAGAPVPCNAAGATLCLERYRMRSRHATSRKCCGGELSLWVRRAWLTKSTARAAVEEGVL